MQKYILKNKRQNGILIKSETTQSLHQHVDHQSENLTNLEDVRLEIIARKLIYNKEGQLVHQNAPGPDSEEIRKLLDKYTKE